MNRDGTPTGPGSGPGDATRPELQRRTAASVRRLVGVFTRAGGDAVSQLVEADRAAAWLNGLPGTAIDLLTMHPFDAEGLQSAARPEHERVGDQAMERRRTGPLPQSRTRREGIGAGAPPFGDAGVRGRAGGDAGARASSAQELIDRSQGRSRVPLPERFGPTRSIRLRRAADGQGMPSGSRSALSSVESDGAATSLPVDTGQVRLSSDRAAAAMRPAPPSERAPERVARVVPVAAQLHGVMWVMKGLVDAASAKGRCRAGAASVVNSPAARSGSTPAPTWAGGVASAREPLTHTGHDAGHRTGPHELNDRSFHSVREADDLLPFGVQMSPRRAPDSLMADDLADAVAESLIEQAHRSGLDMS